MGSTRLWPEEYWMREENGCGVGYLRRGPLCTTDPWEARELTALRDDIDVGARLADAADMGESVRASLELEGKAAPVDAVGITVA